MPTTAPIATDLAGETSRTESSKKLCAPRFVAPGMSSVRSEPGAAFQGWVLAHEATAIAAEVPSATPVSRLPRPLGAAMAVTFAATVASAVWAARRATARRDDSCSRQARATDAPAAPDATAPATSRRAPTEGLSEREIREAIAESTELPALITP